MEEKELQQPSYSEGYLPRQQRTGNISPDDSGERQRSGFDQNQAFYYSTTNADNEALEPTAAPVSTSHAGDRTASIWPGQAFQIYNKIAKLQHKFFGIHTRLNSERDALRPRLNNMNEALSNLGQLLEQSFPCEIPASNEYLWKTAHDQFVTSQQSFEDQIQLIDDLEQRLGKLLYRLAKTEPEFLQVVDACFKRERQGEDGASTTGSFNSRSSSLLLNSLEQQYYDKRGDVRLLRERLINHKADLQALLDEQAVSLASTTGDDNLRPTASQKQLEIEQKAILKELHIAEEEMVLFWNQCQNAKLDVGELDMENHLTERATAQSADRDLQESELVDLDLPPFLPNDHHGSLPGFLRDIGWSTRPERFLPYIEGLAKYARKRQFIEDWVGKVPLSKFASPGPIEFEHKITSPKSEPDWAYLHWISDDVGLATDYIMVEKEDEAAPDGAILESREPGFVQRMLRRVMSDGTLGTRGGLVSKPSNRGSRQMHQRANLE